MDERTNLVDDLQWESVNSASGWIRSCAYDDMFGELLVEFKDGAICVYEVDKSHFINLVNAPSAGTYLHSSGIYNLPYYTL